jgi:acyl carrier protein
MTQDEIFGKLKAILLESLSVDEDQVTPQARLQADLGAESIDFLDIMFRMERTFGLPKIDKNELFPDSIFQGDPKFVQNGLVTPSGLTELRAKMPYADLTTFEKNPKFDAIGDLFTVDLIARYVKSKVDAK